MLLRDTGWVEVIATTVLGRISAISECRLPFFLHEDGGGMLPLLGYRASKARCIRKFWWSRVCLFKLCLLIAFPHYSKTALPLLWVSCDILFRSILIMGLQELNFIFSTLLIFFMKWIEQKKLTALHHLKEILSLKLRSGSLRPASMSFLLCYNKNPKTTNLVTLISGAKSGKNFW